MKRNAVAKNFRSIERRLELRHEPIALDMRQILTDQPPGCVPSAVCALTRDALDSPFLPTSW